MVRTKLLGKNLSSPTSPHRPIPRPGPPYSDPRTRLLSLHTLSPDAELQIRSLLKPGWFLVSNSFISARRWIFWRTWPVSHTTGEVSHQIIISQKECWKAKDCSADFNNQQSCKVFFLNSSRMERADITWNCDIVSGNLMFTFLGFIWKIYLSSRSMSPYFPLMKKCPFLSSLY